MDLGLIKSINIRTLFDVYSIDEYKESYEKWGKYGWALIDSAPATFFRTQPIDQKDADRKAMTFFDNISIEKLLSSLLEQSSNIINEAVLCFRNKTYRGCAMIIVSLFEGDLLRLQSLANGRNRRVGRDAVKRVKVKMDCSQKINEYNIPQLYKSNMVSFLETLFSPTEKGFRAKGIKENISRDYLMHGMYHKQIRKRDCKNYLMHINIGFT